eukprot:UN33992
MIDIDKIVDKFSQDDILPLFALIAGACMQSDKGKECLDKVFELTEKEQNDFFS